MNALLAGDRPAPGVRADARPARRRRRGRPRARSSPSPVRAAAASPPCCTAWPGSCGSTPARCTTATRTSALWTEAARSRLRRTRVRRAVPVRSAGARADRGRERRPAAAARRHGAARGAEGRDPVARTGSASPTSPTSCPAAMSGGQQQRCAVARALVTEPRVLFADEPTGALDVLTGEQVLTEIVQVAREQGTAVVLVTHEPQIAAYADREIVLRDGVRRPERARRRRRESAREAGDAGAAGRGRQPHRPPAGTALTAAERGPGLGDTAGGRDRDGDPRRLDDQPNGERTCAARPVRQRAAGRARDCARA